MTSHIESYINGIERDFLQSKASIATLLKNSRSILREQSLQTMRTLLEAYPEDDPDLLNAMDEFVFFTEGAPEALLARGQCLIANNEANKAAKDLRAVIDEGNERERRLANQLLKDLLG